eukprot:jgi/Ulvmu1/12408/UM009_0058.1
MRSTKSQAAEGTGFWLGKETGTLRISHAMCKRLKQRAEVLLARGQFTGGHLHDNDLSMSRDFHKDDAYKAVQWVVNKLWSTDEDAAAAPPSIRPYLRKDLQVKLHDTPHRLVIFQAAQISVEHRRVQDGVRNGTYTGVAFEGCWRGRFSVRSGDDEVVVVRTAAEAAHLRDLRMLEKRGVSVPFNFPQDIERVLRRGAQPPTAPAHDLLPVPPAARKPRNRVVAPPRPRSTPRAVAAAAKACAAAAAAQAHVKAQQEFWDCGLSPAASAACSGSRPDELEEASGGAARHSHGAVHGAVLNERLPQTRQQPSQHATATGGNTAVPAGTGATACAAGTADCIGGRSTRAASGLAACEPAAGPCAPEPCSSAGAAGAAGVAGAAGAAGVAGAAGAAGVAGVAGAAGVAGERTAVAAAHLRAKVCAQSSTRKPIRWLRMLKRLRDAEPQPTAETGVRARAQKRRTARAATKNFGRNASATTANARALPPKSTQHTAARSAARGAAAAHPPAHGPPADTERSDGKLPVSPPSQPGPAAAADAPADGPPVALQDLRACQRQAGTHGCESIVRGSRHTAPTAAAAPSAADPISHEDSRADVRHATCAASRPRKRRTAAEMRAASDAEKRPRLPRTCKVVAPDPTPYQMRARKQPRIQEGNPPVAPPLASPAHSTQHAAEQHHPSHLSALPRGGDGRDGVDIPAPAACAGDAHHDDPHVQHDPGVQCPFECPSDSGARTGASSSAHAARSCVANQVAHVPAGAQPDATAQAADAAADAAAAAAAAPRALKSAAFASKTLRSGTVLNKLPNVAAAQMLTQACTMRHTCSGRGTNVQGDDVAARKYNQSFRTRRIFKGTYVQRAVPPDGVSSVQESASAPREGVSSLQLRPGSALAVTGGSTSTGAPGPCAVATGHSAAVPLQPQNTTASGATAPQSGHGVHFVLQPQSRARCRDALAHVHFT